MQTGSVAEWVAAIATVAAVLGGLASFAIAVRDRVRDQASRIAIRYLREETRHRLAQHRVEVDNYSDAVIFDPVVEHFGAGRTPRPQTVFDLLDGAVAYEWLQNESGGRPLLRRFEAGQSGSFVFSRDEPRQLVVRVHFLDARQRAWRYDVGKTRLRRVRRNRHPVAAGLLSGGTP